MALLIKFGEKEHLEQLKQGIVHFSTFDSFQKDPTNFRGDKMEGRIYLDPSAPLQINGNDYSKYVKEAMLSFIHDCPVLSFSASMLSDKNCHLITEELYTPNEDFIAEMEQFGGYVLIFDALTFINSLRKTFENAECGLEFKPVVYIDKHNYLYVQDYYESLVGDRKEFAHLFIKDTANSYPLQNEWRMVIFDYKRHYYQEKTSGINIQTSFSTNMPICSIDEFKSLQCSRGFLCI